MVNYFISITFVTLSLFLFKIDSKYAISCAFIFNLYYFYKTIIKKINPEQILIIFSINIIIIFNLLVSDKPDYYHFFRTYLMVFMFFICYIPSLRSNLKIIPKIDFNKIVKISASVILIFEIYQVINALVFQDYSSWFYLDNFSISTAIDISRFQASNLILYYRPISFFHEPSYLAAVLMILLAINDINKNSILLRCSIIIGIFLTLSTTIILFYVLYESTLLIKSNKTTILIYLFAILIILFLFSGELIEITRLNEIFIKGTSGYIRLILPLEQTLFDLRDSYTGIALGQYTEITNNSVYLFFTYFGIFTIPMFIIYYYKLYFLLSNKILFIRYSLISLMLMCLNGAIFSFESTFLLLIYNYSYFYKYEKH